MISCLFRRTASIYPLIIVCGCVNVQSDATKLPEATNVPEIKQSYQTKTKLLRDARELGDIGTELDSVATRISNQRVVIPVGSPETIVTSLIESTRSLRESAKQILDKGPQYIEKLDSFSSTLQAAPATFINAAQLFRKFADEEQYADVAEDYRQVAILFDNLATRTQKTGVRLRERYNRDALLEALKYIRHQERFLDRFEAALQTQISDRELEAFLHKIETYAKQFEQLRKQIRQLNTTFRSLDDQPSAENG